MVSPPGPATPRRRWLRWLGVVALVLLGFVGFSAGRLWWQHRKHHELREAEVGRAPVVAAKSKSSTTPVARPTAVPRGVLCLQGIVLEGSAPVAGMQVSLPNPDWKGAGVCSGPCDATRLSQLLASPRAGLLEPVKSATSGPDGRFVLCGLSEPLPPFVFGEHPDGRVALPVDTWSPLEAGKDIELAVPLMVPVEGLVTTRAGLPVKGRLLLYSNPALVVREAMSDATGHFSATLPVGALEVVVEREGLAPVEARAHHLHRLPLLITITEPSTITVRALSKGQPVPGAEVVVGGGAPQLTDAKGEVSLTLVGDTQQHIVVKKGELIGTVSRFARASSARIDVDLTPGVRLDGTVIDEKGQGRIAVVTGFPGGGTLDTDATGHFVTPLLPRQALQLHAALDGCASARASVDGDAPKPVLLELRCEPTVTGMVLDAEGNPLAGAEVSLQGTEYEALTTKTDGHFALHVPAGAYQLTVDHHDYRSEQRPLTVPAKDVAVVLDAGGSIAGKVVDEKGRGIPGADVTAFPGVIDELFRQAEGALRGGTTSGDDGTFRIKGLLAGRWIVFVSGASLPSSPSEPVMLEPGEHKEGVVVKVEGTVDLTGTVLDDHRRPIPSARVKWEPTDEKAALTSVILDVVGGRMEEAVRFLPSDVFTGVDGRFELKNVQVKDVKVTAFAQGHESSEVKTTRGSTIELVLHENAATHVKGRAVDEAGHPVTRFDVNTEHFANDEGAFEIETEAGKAYFHFTAPGFSATNFEREVKAPTHDLGTVTFLRGVPLVVKVTKEDGKPLELANVFARQEGDSESCATSSEGRCTMKTLQDEATKVTISHTGFLEKVVELPKGQLSQPLEVTLSAAGGRLEGVVFAAPGRPAIARRLSVNATNDQDFTLTDERGHFTVSGLPEGPGCVTVELSGLLGTEWAFPVMLSKTPTPVMVGPSDRGGTLVTKSTLPGRVLVLGGAAGPVKASVIGSGMVSTLCSDKRVPVVSYITTGEARLEGLPAGKWSVYLVAVTEVEDEKEIAPTVVDLAAGETKRVP